VAAPAEFCKSLAALAYPGGATVISTINRSMRAYVTAIVAAEYLLNWVWFLLILVSLCMLLISMWRSLLACKSFTLFVVPGHASECMLFFNLHLLNISILVYFHLLFAWEFISIMTGT
jgi:hypothetical protein